MCLACHRRKTQLVKFVLPLNYIPVICSTKGNGTFPLDSEPSPSQIVINSPALLFNTRWVQSYVHKLSEKIRVRKGVIGKPRWIVLWIKFQFTRGCCNICEQQKGISIFPYKTQTTSYYDD